ncbi:MAG: PD-(D/E)XK nuclease family protein [Rubrobacter sp.]|nr:PD-(D/E)XK nuclease family protein [Rubrobacter sp.]
MDAHAAASLLDEFRKLPSRIERPQTFLEIGGYPHYENQCSNFLAFFFDPEGPHGLGSLFLDALMNSLGVEDGEESLVGGVSVDREVGTKAGNRIDILIKSGSHAVLIENKIHAAAVNPFDDYSTYLDRLKDEDGTAYKNKIKVLLTLYPSGEGSDWGFVNLTHADFVSAVRSALGHHVHTADNRYLTFMLDFLNTLENLGEGTRMNQKFVKLLADRTDEVVKFQEGVKQVRDEVRGKVQSLGELIELKGYQRIQQVPWQPNQNYRPISYLQYRVHINDESYVVVEPAISPNGWEIRLFRRIPRKAQDRLELEKLLNEHKILPEHDLSVHPERFAYDEEDLNSIAAVVQNELSRVASIVQDIANELSASSAG